MIRVWFYYRKKGFGNKWFKSYKDFTDVKKAFRFIMSINSPDKESFVDSWECDDSEDNEYLWSRVH